jgi:hypothetical protein
MSSSVHVQADCLCDMASVKCTCLALFTAASPLPSMRHCTWSPIWSLCSAAACAENVNVKVNLLTSCYTCLLMGLRSCNCSGNPGKVKAQVHALCS